jgi:hypothetical protein
VSRPGAPSHATTRTDAGVILEIGAEQILIPWHTIQAGLGSELELAINAHEADVDEMERWA